MDFLSTQRTKTWRGKNVKMQIFRWAMKRSATFASLFLGSSIAFFIFLRLVNQNPQKSNKNLCTSLLEQLS
jgi:hypothetical protein